MTIEIKGIRASIAELEELDKFLGSPKPMQGFVDDAKIIILEKTASGKDYKNRSFEPYSEKYAKRKEGMTATGRPNLKLSGTMISSIFTRILNAFHGQIDVAPNAEKGKANARMLAEIHSLGVGKQPQREFMNLNESNIAKLKKKHWDDPILAIVRKYR